MKKTHYILYALALPWNITVCWPIVMLIRLFWGKNLRWERNPDPEVRDGYSLWCDLKKNSWPARTWYARYEKGWWFLKGSKRIESVEWNKERYGDFWTWGGTTLGHGGFYGPGQVLEEEPWSRIQHHEHIHVEQFEAAMFRAFLEGLLAGVVLLGFGHPMAGLRLGLFLWWFGYLAMGTANWTTAALRGESAYMGSHHEEAAYALQDGWEEAAQAAEEDADA